MASREDLVFEQLAKQNTRLGTDDFTAAHGRVSAALAQGRRLSLAEALVGGGKLSERESAVLCAGVEYTLTRERSKKFARRAVKKGYVSQQQVDQALQDQARQFSRGQVIVGVDDLLCRQGALNPAQRDGIWAEYRQWEERQGDSDRPPPLKARAAAVSSSRDVAPAPPAAVRSAPVRASAEAPEPAPSPRGGATTSAPAAVAVLPPKRPAAEEEVWDEEAEAAAPAAAVSAAAREFPMDNARRYADEAAAVLPAVRDTLIDDPDDELMLDEPSAPAAMDSEPVTRAPPAADDEPAGDGFGAADDDFAPASDGFAPAADGGGFEELRDADAGGFEALDDAPADDADAFALADEPPLQGDEPRLVDDHRESDELPAWQEEPAGAGVMNRAPAARPAAPKDDDFELSEAPARADDDTDPEGLALDEEPAGAGRTDTATDQPADDAFEFLDEEAGDAAGEGDDPGAATDPEGPPPAAPAHGGRGLLDLLPTADEFEALLDAAPLPDGQAGEVARALAGSLYQVGREALADAADDPEAFRRDPKMLDRVRETVTAKLEAAATERATDLASEKMGAKVPKMLLKKLVKPATKAAVTQVWDTIERVIREAFPPAESAPAAAAGERGAAEEDEDSPFAFEESEDAPASGPADGAHDDVGFMREEREDDAQEDTDAAGDEDEAPPRRAAAAPAAPAGFVATNLVQFVAALALLAGFLLPLADFRALWGDEVWEGVGWVSPLDGLQAAAGTPGGWPALYRAIDRAGWDRGGYAPTLLTGLLVLPAALGLLLLLRFLIFQRRKPGVLGVALLHGLGGSAMTLAAGLLVLGGSAVPNSLGIGAWVLLGGGALALLGGVLALGGPRTGLKAGLLVAAPAIVFGGFFALRDTLAAMLPPLTTLI